MHDAQNLFDDATAFAGEWKVDETLDALSREGKLELIVVGIGWAAVVSLPFAIMSEKVDKRRMGYFMGLFNLSVVLPQLATTVVGYILKDALDKSVLFMICGGCLAVSSVLWLLVREDQAALAPAPALAH